MHLKHTGRPPAVTPAMPSIPGRPRCPRYLSAEAKVVFRRYADALERLGVGGRQLEGLLTVFADTFEEWRAARRDIEVNGRDYAITNETGVTSSIQPRPAVARLHKTRGDLMRMLTAMGLTPAAGRILGAAPPDVQDDLSEIRERSLRLVEGGGGE